MLRFWSAEAGFEGPAAQERLDEVVCAALDDDGEVVGVNSVHGEVVPLIGDRRFWVYRALFSEGAKPVEPEMVNRAFSALQEEFDPDGGGPLGLYVLSGDGVGMASLRPEAVWPETELLHAGYDDDDNQCRIRYFDDAPIAPGQVGALTTQQMWDLPLTLPDNYSIVPYAPAEVAPEDVVAFWEREGAVAGEEARRRVAEVQTVALERDAGLAAVATAYLQHNPQLGMDLWHYRGYVGRDHRMNNLASRFAIDGRDQLERRFTSGEDIRGRGILYEIENDLLKTYLNKGRWVPSDFTFIGENDRGDHVRVHYFEGATVPPRV